MTMLVGITGGIGSGKSTIARELRHRGYSVYDTDQQAKRLIVENPAIREKMMALFGREVYDGNLYRTDIVARHVFADAALLRQLNQIVHPAVSADLTQWKADHPQQLIFVESAILFSSGLYQQCDRMVMVTAPEQICIERTMARDHADINKVRARIRAQRKDADLQSAAADILIVNDGSQSVSDLADLLLSRLNADS